MKAMKGINARRKPKPFEVQYFIKYRILQLKSVYNSGKGNCLKKIYIYFFFIIRTFQRLIISVIACQVPCAPHFSALHLVMGLMYI